MKLKLREVTLSYPSLATARAGSKPGDKPKFQAALVLKPDSKYFAENLAAARAAVNAVAEENFGKTGPEKIRTGALKCALRSDGEAKNYGPGTYFINARSDRKPGIVFAWAGPDNKPAVMPDEVIEAQMYPGAIVNVSLDVYSYNREDGKGVTFGLGNLQKVRDGERLDGRVAATDEFDADLSAAPADLDALAA